MRRLAIFLVAVAVALGVVMALIWRVDPSGVFSGADPLRASLARADPCLISDRLVGEPSWPRFKLALFRERAPRTIVIGTSRALAFRARAGERGFANLGFPGTGIETLAPFFARLRAAERGALTVYVAVEPFWLNRTWVPSARFSLDWLATLRYLTSRQDFKLSIREAWNDPGALGNGWDIVQVGGRCVFDRGGVVAAGKQNAWDVDGSLRYSFDLVPTVRRPPDDDYTRDLVTFEGVYYRDWRELDHARLEVLGRALDLARSYGWRVIGFSPPYSSRYVARLSSAPETAVRWSEFGDVVPRLFRARGFPFLDLRAGRDVPCGDSEYVDDGWHPSDACAARVRRRLDAAAAP